MAVPYHFAICNELFQAVPFGEACTKIRDLGYTGLEIAPFTLGADAAQLTQEDRRSLRGVMGETGIKFVGVHWLLVGPPGLHATTGDQTVRRRTWDYIRSLIDLCADLRGEAGANDTVMVFGSPKQRSAVDGMDPGEAVRILTHELSMIARHAENQGVKILLEPLSPAQTDVVTSLAEAAAIVKQIGSPAIQTMFDVHNAVDEREPHVRLIREFAPVIRHVHVNEFDGREPGTGEYDFGQLLSTLADLNYAGWVSLEVFDFSRDPLEVARRALHYLLSVVPAGTLSQTI